MRRREQEQAELLDRYWTAVTHGPAATPPAELDPGVAAVSRRLVSLLSPAEPEAAFAQQLRRQIEGHEPTAISWRSAEVVGWRLGWPLPRIAAVAAVFLLAAVLVSGGVYAALNLIPSPGPPPPRASLEELRLVAQGVDKSAGTGEREVGYAFIVENPDGDRAAEGGTYRLTAFDLRGGTLATSSGTVPVLLPGQKLGIGGLLTLAPGETVDRLNIEITAGELVNVEGQPTLGAEDVKYRADGDTPKVTGIISNPYREDIQEVTVSAIAYNAEGMIIGGGGIVVDTISASGQEAVEIPVTSSGPPERVEIYAAVSRLPAGDS